jgi:hypothetical protein
MLAAVELSAEEWTEAPKQISAMDFSGVATRLAAPGGVVLPPCPAANQHFYRTVKFVVALRDIAPFVTTTPA